MPDFVSRKKLKKKALDSWENEGGQILTAAAGKKLPGSQSSPKRKRRKARQRQLTDAGSA